MTIDSAAAAQNKLRDRHLWFRLASWETALVFSGSIVGNSYLAITSSSSSGVTAGIVVGFVIYYDPIGCSRFLTAYSISEDQLRITDRGAALGSSTRVLIRNFRPSLVTS